MSEVFHSEKYNNYTIRVYSSRLYPGKYFTAVCFNDEVIYQNPLTFKETIDEAIEEGKSWIDTSPDERLSPSQKNKTWKARLARARENNKVLTLLGYAVVFIMAMFYLGALVVASYDGLSFYTRPFGAVVIFVICLLFRVVFPLSVGAFLGAWSVWHWHWSLAALFAFPISSVFLFFFISYLIKSKKTQKKENGNATEAVAGSDE